jgi:hypothetical protein
MVADLESHSLENKHMAGIDTARFLRYFGRLVRRNALLRKLADPKRKKLKPALMGLSAIEV